MRKAAIDANNNITDGNNKKDNGTHEKGGRNNIEVDGSFNLGDRTFNSSDGT